MSTIVIRSLALKALIAQAQSSGSSSVTLSDQPQVSIDWVPRDSAYVRAGEDPNAYMIHIGSRDIGRVTFDMLVNPEPAWARSNASLFIEWDAVVNKTIEDYKQIAGMMPRVGPTHPPSYSDADVPARAEAKDPVAERRPETLEKKLDWLIANTPHNGTVWSGFGAEIVVKIDTSGQRRVEATVDNGATWERVSPAALIIRPVGGEFWLDGGRAGYRTIAMYWADMTQLLATVRLPVD